MAELGDGEDGGLFGPKTSFSRRFYDIQSLLGQFIGGYGQKIDDFCGPEANTSDHTVLT